MTEQDEADKYIKCSKCRCKYINDDYHINIDFGYNRLNERFKTCVKCRGKHKAYIDNRMQQVDSKTKCCTRCSSFQPISYFAECGETFKS